MKLSDIKTALIEQFFNSETQGVAVLDSFSVFTTLREHLSSPAEQEFIDDLGSQSNDPSKAFGMFSRDGREANLRIIEEDGMKQTVIFAASRVGKNVSYTDLTNIDKSPKTGTLASIKQALKQAKNRNEEIVFSIANRGK